MTDQELKQLVESNARTDQAILDAMVEDRLERQQLREGMIRLENVVERLTNIQQGVNNLLASLDSDSPTILRKLTAIENKVDRLLEREQEN
ncbi:hypothetical protein [Iningainema tapete]|uniref:Uncharacterized protein n=1 Tax=Iningainema tapete BLCC-T55 TaxID=2748662 RepID=A0A8J7BWP2_9CYAN|nr:hypothetical protein [Iningainema tapete]MBD2771288.1 hypothetical protein [Iningainema tapete BLCC-T55]